MKTRAHNKPKQTEKLIISSRTISEQIAALPAKLQNSVCPAYFGPEISPRDFRLHARQAFELNMLCSPELEIQYDPGSLFEDDHESWGNLFRVSPKPEFQDVTLDARSGNLRLQLKEQLEQIAERFTALASRLSGFPKEGFSHG